MLRLVPIPPKPETAGKPARCDDPLISDLRFRSLLGADAWNRLPEAVRARFSKRLSDQHAAIYGGQIIETRFSRLGWCVAQAVRLIGGPLPRHRVSDVPATVTVTEDAACKGQHWTRVYGRRRGFPQVIHSSKRFQGPTGLEEYIGYGVGMALTVDTDAYTIRFRSAYYFLQAGGRHWRLPKWLTPGTVTVGHTDFGAGQFVFSLDLHHPLFGELIHQRGIFRDQASET